MAFSEWASFKKAEWEHTDRVLNLQETERTNRANENIKQQNLEFEKDKLAKTLSQQEYIANLNAETSVKSANITAQGRVESANIGLIGTRESNIVKTNLGNLSAYSSIYATNQQAVNARLSAETSKYVANVSASASRYSADQHLAGINASNISSQVIAQGNRENALAITKLNNENNLSVSYNKSIVDLSGNLLGLAGDLGGALIKSIEPTKK